MSRTPQQHYQYDDQYDDQYTTNPQYTQNRAPHVNQYQPQYNTEQQPNRNLNVEHVNDTAVMDDFLSAFEAPQIKVPQVQQYQTTATYDPRQQQQQRNIPPVQQYQSSSTYNEPRQQQRNAPPVQQYQSSTTYNENSRSRVDNYESQNYPPRGSPQQKPTKQSQADYDYDSEEEYKPAPVKKTAQSEATYMYRMLHTNTHGSTRQVTVYDSNNDSEHVYRAHICLDPLKIKIEFKDELFDIKQKLLSLHPTFIVKRNGSKYGTCTQRFKVNSKKFNYEIDSTKQMLKMVGEYGHHFAVNKNGELIAKVVDVKSELTVEIDSRKDEPHIVCLCMIMLQQRFLGVMGGGKPSEFEKRY